MTQLYNWDDTEHFQVGSGWRISVPDATFVQDVVDELTRARSKFPPIHSHHEGYAVIYEELEEFFEEIRQKPDKVVPQRVYDELVQVAAMAMRTAVDCE